MRCWIDANSTTEIDPELVTLELEAAYQDHSLPSDVRSGLETFVSTELHIDLNTWTRDAEHALINSSGIAADSLNAFETPGDTADRPSQMGNNNNNSFMNILAPVPPPPPPPPGKGSSIRGKLICLTKAAILTTLHRPYWAR